MLGLGVDVSVLLMNKCIADIMVKRLTINTCHQPMADGFEHLAGEKIQGCILKQLFGR